MEIIMQVSTEVEYEAVIKCICDDETWGGEVGWDRDEKHRRTLILQVPIRNGGQSVLELIDGALEEDSGIMTGEPWNFKADPGLFRERMVAEMERNLHALFLGLQSVQGRFNREPYVYIEIAETSAEG